jgi:hypothetical protein
MPNMVVTVGKITAEDLHHRHHVTPWAARPLRARVARTLLRSRTVAVDGRIVTESRGRLVGPRGGPPPHDQARGTAAPRLGGKP